MGVYNVFVRLMECSCNGGHTTRPEGPGRILQGNWHWAAATETRLHCLENGINRGSLLPESPPALRKRSHANRPASDRTAQLKRGGQQLCVECGIEAASNHPSSVHACISGWFWLKVVCYHAQACPLENSEYTSAETVWGSIKLSSIVCWTVCSNKCATDHV
ncbi:hypothetical protein IF2G_05490 [Cordyceps javanica]|nr:hypothetical protein IF2G_05490 [Cordyceps javanica]